MSVPWAGGVAIAYVSVSGGTSGSVPASVSASPVLNATFADCAVAAGVPGVTVMDTVAAGLTAAPFCTLNVRLSAPL